MNRIRFVRRRAGVVRLAVLFALLVVGPTTALTFHEVYGRSYEFGELTSVSSGLTPGAIASANFPQGKLLRVQPTGKLAWVRSYGTTMLSAARELPTGGFAWIGTGETKKPGFAPVVARVDSLGTVLWARVLNLALPTGPEDQVYGRFLEVDPRDGGLWVGGELWRSAFDDSVPWLGKLDPAGTLLWAKLVHFPDGARFHSLFPALGSGVVAVGEIATPRPAGPPQVQMLAAALGAEGNLLWAFRYQVVNSDRSESAQLLADLDRDPRFSLPQDAVVGTVTHFCKSAPSAPCDPVGSAAFVATLDETNGNLLKSRGLFSPNRPNTFGETIVQDLPGEVMGVGGEIALAASGPRQGFLSLLDLSMSAVRGAMTHGVAGFDADLRSLDRWSDAGDRGYLFLLNESFAPRFVPTELRSLVKTDRRGASGTCECETDLTTFEAYLAQVPLQPELIPGSAEPFLVKAEQAELFEEPCGLLPCHSGPNAHPAWQVRGPSGAAEARPAPVPAGILPGIPGALGSQRGMSLRTLPLRAGARLKGLAGQRGERLTFFLEVPKGTRDLALCTAGGTGNVDLLVSRSRPTPGKSAANGARTSRGKENAEAVRLHRPSPGAWYVTLEGTAAFAGVTLSVEGGR